MVPQKEGIPMHRAALVIASVLLVGTGVLTSIMLIHGSDTPARAQGGLVGASSPVPRQSRDSTPLPPSPQSPLPLRASYEVVPESFAEHVIHTTEEYYYNHGISDKVNGVQDTITDVWLQVDGNGHVEKVHATTRNR